MKKTNKFIAINGLTFRMYHEIDAPLLPLMFDNFKVNTSGTFYSGFI